MCRFFSLAIIRIIFSRVHLAGVKMINVCAFFGLVFIFTYLFCNALMFFFIYAGLDLISRLFHRETMFLLAVSVCVFFVVVGPVHSSFSTVLLHYLFVIFARKL